MIVEFKTGRSPKKAGPGAGARPADPQSARFSLLFTHDLFGKPVSTFPDHALAAVETRRRNLVWWITIIKYNRKAGLRRSFAD